MEPVQENDGRMVRKKEGICDFNIKSHTRKKVIQFRKFDDTCAWVNEIL